MQRSQSTQRVQMRATCQNVIKLSVEMLRCEVENLKIRSQIVGGNKRASVEDRVQEQPADGCSWTRQGIMDCLHIWLYMRTCSPLIQITPKGVESRNVFISTVTVIPLLHYQCREKDKTTGRKLLEIQIHTKLLKAFTVLQY